MRLVPGLLVVLGACLRLGSAQSAASANLIPLDSDHDGLTDQTEQALLEQFVPTFMVAMHDCSNIPSEFKPDIKTPTVLRENGTIYGQVFPSHFSTPEHPSAELHFYHLWRIDCGPHGHHLDTEHVAVLVQASGRDLSSASWRAEYWYAAAHENTVCDVSQITRASTLRAEDHGAKVWISPGKHASFLNEALCNHGCGADRCVNMIALRPAKIVNLGEVGAPMNGSTFIASEEWPLTVKMQTSNFLQAPIARLELLPDSNIAWFNRGRHPAQRVIAAGGSTEQALATSGGHTTAALSTAGNDTDVAMSVAEGSTDGALGKAYSRTKHALGTSAKHVGQAIHVHP